MKTLDRRQFVGAAAGGLAALGSGALGVTRPSGPGVLRPARRTASSSRAIDLRIDVLLQEPIATIAPEIYGHFIEHLGGVIYDGLWVGEGSPIPNVGGIRRDLAEALRRVKPSVVRWPGGCYADSYDWRDGVGPRSVRVTTLAAHDVHDASTFDRPDAVVPRTGETTAAAQPLVFNFPAASVTKLEIVLAS